MAFGSVIAAGISGPAPRATASTTRHHGVDVVRVRRLDRLAEPRHDELRAALSGASVSSVSAGWSQACIARLNVPQCTGRKAPPPSSASAFSAFSRPEVDVAPGGMEGADLEHHEVERAEAFADRPILRREAGVAAEEHARGAAMRITSEDHSVALRSFRPRPEKCCDGAAVTVSSGVRQPRAISHQSSSTMRSAGTPQASRCAPTPSEVTKGTSRLRELADRRVVEMVVVVVRDDARGRSAASRAAARARAGSASGRRAATARRAVPRPDR